MSLYTAREFVRTYMTWMSIIQRCVHRGNRADSRFYRERGIGVCERWRSFENFIEDVGARPEGTTLDRIDNAKGYEPGNVRWATPTQQAANTRRARLLTFNGETLPINAWARRLGVSPGTVQKNAERGQPLDMKEQRRSFANGLARGKKLTAEHVREAVRRMSQGEPADAVAPDFGVSGSAMRQLARRFGVHLKKGRPRR